MGDIFALELEYSWLAKIILINAQMAKILGNPKSIIVIVLVRIVKT